MGDIVDSQVSFIDWGLLLLSVEAGWFVGAQSVRRDTPDLSRGAKTRSLHHITHVTMSIHSDPPRRGRSIVRLTLIGHSGPRNKGAIWKGPHPARGDAREEVPQLSVSSQDPLGFVVRLLA